MKEDKKILLKKRVRFSIKLVSYSLIVFLMIISSLLIFYVFSSKYYKSKGMNPPFSLYTIVSSSMEPSINVNDVVFIKKTEPNKLVKGDVITFYSSNPFFGNTPITHRIEKVIREDDKLFFEVKGDANEIPDDELVISTNIIGRVYFRLPYFGNIQYFIASKKGILVAIIIPAVFILFYDSIKILKELRLRRERKEIEELESISKDKEEAVRSQKFEKAASLRDKEMELRKAVEKEEETNRDVIYFKLKSLLRTECDIKQTPSEDIIDEIDSGLDVDGLEMIAKSINSMLDGKFSCLIISHYSKLYKLINLFKAL